MEVSRAGVTPLIECRGRMCPLGSDPLGPQRSAVSHPLWEKGNVPHALQLGYSCWCAGHGLYFL